MLGYEANNIELADLYHQAQDELKHLEPRIARLQRVAAGLVSGRYPLEPEVCKAVIHWKNLLARKVALQKAIRGSWGATQPPGTCPPDQDLGARHGIDASGGREAAVQG